MSQGEKFFFWLPLSFPLTNLTPSMNKFIAALMVLSVGSLVIADIHEPPKAKYTKNRKLNRGLSNILYSWTEIPVTMIRYSELHTSQSHEIWNGAFFHGLQRSGARLKFGIYEVINFQRPLYKDSYRPAMDSINYLPRHGYEEFPPQIGNLTTTGYTRGRSW